MTRHLVPFWRYVVALVAEKERAPQDDLTSDLLRMRDGDDTVLTLNEIASCMITLLVAGHETTTAQIQQCPAAPADAARALGGALRGAGAHPAGAGRDDALRSVGLRLAAAGGRGERDQRRRHPGGGRTCC